MIAAELIGAPRLIDRLTQTGPRVRNAVSKQIVRQTIALQAHVVADKLSGQVVNVKTGRLRRSITQRVDGAGTDQVVGTVGTNVEYAARIEFGFKGTETVKEHLRTATQAWGRPIKNPAPHTVHAFTRKVNAPERSFLRSALEDRRGEILTSISKAVELAVQQEGDGA